MSSFWHRSAISLSSVSVWTSMTFVPMVSSNWRLRAGLITSGKERRSVISVSDRVGGPSGRELGVVVSWMA